MDNIYFIMIIALAVLAIADLVVGVSNDAVNFLNSAIGSKAISFRTIMIVASLGIAFGAIFSSGMMEVARKGIFNPGEFMFDEIMIIFMAVMITDILLLDFFNSVGMPTSTTVSIVFELLGAAVAIALIKIGHSGGDFSDVINYINTSKASQIIFGILFGMLFMLLIYALFVGIFLKNTLYLYFAMCIFASATLLSILEGYTFQYLFPHHPNLSNISMPFVASFLSFSITHFTRKFLKTKEKAPILHKILFVVILSSFFTALLSLFDNYSPALANFHWYSVILSNSAASFRLITISPSSK